jgi:Dolichyl-phosphate-mannose-protein mannosyltransferase
MTTFAGAIVRRWPVVALAAIVVLGGWLRLAGNDWDAGAHLHPDERYLTMVADQVAWPPSVGVYFDVARSPLSPYNTDLGRSYLYGLLPLLATKATATALGRDAYATLNLVGRRLSGLVDTASILVVFLIGRALLLDRGRRTGVLGGLLAAALYALSVLPIQYSHFFTAESWLVFFTLVTFYLATLVARVPLEERVSPRTLGLLAAAGAALGLVTASKVSGIFVALPLALALVLRPGGDLTWRVRLTGTAIGVLTASLSAYVAFRLVSPYAFAHSNWLYLQPSPELRTALEEQQRSLNGDYLYPPAWQWLRSTRLWSPLENVVVWGVGVPLGLAGLAGLGWLAVDAVRRVRRSRPVLEAMVLAFVALEFLYWGSRFAHSLRYLVAIVPFLCIAAAAGICDLTRVSRFAARFAAAGVLLGTLLYALAFAQIYRHQNTRVAASQWIAANVTPGSTIVSEHWDDALPVTGGERYRLRELPVFDPDDSEKLRKLYDGLSAADMYALSSPRAWNTIGRLPSRFPLMSRFYDRLAAGELGFRKAAQFTSYPRLLGVELDDLDGEEAFWVYDHPPVILYRRDRSLSWPEFQAALCRGAPRPPGCG